MLGICARPAIVALPFWAVITISIEQPAGVVLALIFVGVCRQVPCPAMQPDGGSGTRVRFLTRRECARLMGFPEWFRVDLDFGLASGGGATKKHEAVDGNRFYAQIGNAVCPPIVTALAGPLLDLMNIPRHDSTFAEVSAGRTEHSMEIDCQRSKRKREMERHACAARPECGCSKVFVLG